MKIQDLENFLYNIKEYNVIFKFLYNEKISNINYIYDFFLILKKEKEIKSIYTKYISKFTSGLGVIKGDINIKELIECINDSKCINDNKTISENKCDYNKLSSYVYNFCLNKNKNQVEINNKQDKDNKKNENLAKKKNKRKNKKKNKYINTINIEEDEKKKIESEHNGN